MQCLKKISESKRASTAPLPANALGTGQPVNTERIKSSIEKLDEGIRIWETDEQD